MNRPYSIEGIALQVIGLGAVVITLALQFEPLMRGNELNWPWLFAVVLSGLLLTAFGGIVILLTRIEYNTRRD